MFPTCLQPWAKPCLSNVPLYVALTKSLQAELFGSCHNWLNRPGASKMSKAAQLRKARDLESRVSNEIKDPMQYFVKFCVYHTFLTHLSICCFAFRSLLTEFFSCFFKTLGLKSWAKPAGIPSPGKSPQHGKLLANKNFFQVLKKDNLCLK